MTELPEIPAAEQLAVLGRIRAIQEAHDRGDDAAANILLAELVEHYGDGAIAVVMAERDRRERLGIEVELL